MRGVVVPMRGGVEWGREMTTIVAIKTAAIATTVAQARWRLAVTS